MKKILALMLCALLAVLPAMAEPDAQPEDIQPQKNSAANIIPLEMNGETVRLVFDGTPQYSSIQGGMVQGSYYAYGSDGVTLYELFLVFPESAKPGMVISPEYAGLTGENCSVTLIVSDENKSVYYVASTMDGGAYPQGSSFTIALNSVERQGDAYGCSGTLSATLVALDMATGEVVDTLSIDETPFGFTLGGDAEQRHTEPAPTPIPDDMRKA